MPTGSVRLQSIKKLGQENQSYEISDEGNALLGLIPDSDNALFNRNALKLSNYRKSVFFLFNLNLKNPQ